MLTLHYLADSRSHRILWLLEELQEPYQVEVYLRDPKTQLAPKKLQDIHPLGRAPILEDDDQILAESGAIVDYLVHTYASERFLPKTTQALQQYRYWMHFSEGTLMPLLVMRYANQIASQKVPGILRGLLMTVPRAIDKTFVGPRIRACLDFVDQHLSQHKFFAGAELSGADFMMIYPLEASRSRTAKSYTHINRYIDRIQASSSYQAALNAVDLPYKLAESTSSERNRL